MGKAEAGQSGGKPPSVVVVEDEAANLDKWLGFMETMLGCVDDRIVEACSISLVPRQLRNSKEDAYTPQVVSIGPLHKGSNTDLLYMEEIKWRCLLRLLQSFDKDQKLILKNCGQAMLNLDAIVRASYNVEVKFNRNELAQIMVLDGCFLLELLISGSPQLKEQLNSSSNDDASLGAEVIKWENVVSDLTMLENQIPLVVLYTLSIILFPQIFTEENSIKLIHELALSMLGYSSPDFSNIYSPEFKGFHFVQLVHSFIDKEKDVTKQNGANTEENEKLEVNKDCKIPIRSEEVAGTSDRKVDKEKDETKQKADEKMDISCGQLKLQRCADRLEAAGVIIKEAKSNASNMAAEPETRFDLKVKFTNGTLEIPQLHITETTEAKWRNFIAWELNRATLKKQHWKRKEDRISCPFICYAWFFRRLTCSVPDVKLLQDRKVISVQRVKTDKGEKNIMSNKDLMNLFRNITDGVPEAEIDMDSRFGQVIEKLNSYPDRVTGTSKLMWHIFRCFLTCFLTWIWYKWIHAYTVLRRVYIPSRWGLIAVFAAAIGLVLTAIQTHYAIHS